MDLYQRGEREHRAHIRRRRLLAAAAGTALVALGARRWIDDEATALAKKERRADGRPRLPPGQRVLSQFRPMGGIPGDPRPGQLRLRIHGEVDAPTTMTMRDLLALEQHEADVDVHCVTGWSVLSAKVRGVSIETICRAVGVLDRAKHLVFEGAAGYTANVPLRALRHRNNLLAYRLDGVPLALENGAPLRAMVPDLYFWKSAKWVTGLRFVEEDAPGYWETRGYHNRADPWEEQRYALF